VGGEQVGHLLIELAKVILDHAQFFQRELQQPPVHRTERRTGLEGIAELLPQPLTQLVLRHSRSFVALFLPF
jgi:hypothetical protein